MTYKTTEQTQQDAPAFDADSAWSPDEAGVLANSLPLAVPAPCVSLMGGNRVYAYRLAYGACLIMVSTTEGKMKRYGVMDAEGLATLRARLAPINPNDHDYPSVMAAAIDDLCHTQVEAVDGPSYDLDDDTWDWSDEDKELGIGCYVGGAM